MRTSEQECLASLREAAERLGKSPTKAEYEELGLGPASATIIRVVGGWNEAKERAGLATEPSTGSRVKPKPDDVTLPDGKEWEELSVDQRWHYRNVEWNTERTLARRSRLRSWVNDRKHDRGCRNCGETDPGCLDFHHQDPATKEMAITELITHGYGREKLREEITKCEVLCANCHRREHDPRPESTAGAESPTELTKHGDLPSDERGVRRAWLYEYKAATGCSRCEETDPRCLVFHHGSSEKRKTVSQMVSDGHPAEEIRNEVDRCTVLCSNCHRREHFEQPE
jgi:hypothetical protein